MADAGVDRILSLGLDEKAVKDMEKNKKLKAALLEVAEEAQIPASGCDRTVGNLLLMIASKWPSFALAHRPAAAKLVANESIKSNMQLLEAMAFVKKLAPDEPLDQAAFEDAAGVGIEVSDEEIKAAVDSAIAEKRDEMLTERYCFPVFSLMYKFKTGRMKWADGKALKTIFDQAVLDLLGPKTEEDDARIAEQKSKGKGKGKGKGKDKGKDKAKAAAKPAAKADAAATEAPDAGANPFAARDLLSARNSTALLEEHRNVTKGLIRTRFPPEPNGYLHVGHAKSMYLNFKGAFELLGAKGETIFRYDDTNPEAESHEYIDSQADNVSWLGWKPCRITHSSDYFDQLHAYAIQLINNDKAYVCHQSKADMEKSRELAKSKSGDPNSPWRNRTVEENLAEFEKMRKGVYAAGEAVLRMKIDMHHENTCMWDPVAYRIKFVPHPRTGDTWCIYPSYDFTHCIVDSIEHIDYSLCTLEFEGRRDSYYWLLEALDIWRPHVWEFSRLNITGTMLSKRKIMKLVNTGTVRGWDDPRLATINGLRRRGFPPQAINQFCAEIGVSRNIGYVENKKLEFVIRSYLDEHAPRGFAVLDPLKVTLVNFPTAGDARLDESGVQWIEDVPIFPRNPEKGSRRMPLSNELYIDRSDFRMEDEKGYYGLAPGKTVGLRYGGLMKCVDVVTDPSGTPTEIIAEYTFEREVKVKGNLHWVSSAKRGELPQKAEFRVYEPLFTTDDVGSTGDWESEINPHSETVCHGFVEPSLAAVKYLDNFQFERVGFYVVDKDAAPEEGKLVFNLTVALKESTGVKQLRK